MAESRRYRRVTSTWSLLFPLVSILIASTCTCYPSQDGFETPSLVEHLSSPSSHRQEEVRPSSWLQMISPSSERLNRQTRNMRRYCGPDLSDVLSLVCQGKYNHKRSFQSPSWKLSGNDERPHLERNRMEGE